MIFAASFLVFLVLSEVTYLSLSKSMTDDMISKKVSFVKLTGLSDLAFFSDVSFLRHRSLSDLYSVYSDDSSLREHSTLTFSIANKGVN